MCLYVDKILSAFLYVLLVYQMTGCVHQLTVIYPLLDGSSQTAKVHAAKLNPVSVNASEIVPLLHVNMKLFIHMSSFLHHS